MKHAVKAYPRWTGHGGEFWQNMVHWRREWQTASVFLPWESQELYENCALDISNFLKEISSLSHSIVFLYFLHWSLRKAFLPLLDIWNSAFRRIYLFFTTLPFTSFVFSAICKASSDNNFAFLFLGFLMLFVGFSRQEHWSGAFPFSSGPHFVRTLHYVPSILGGPTWHGS